MVSDRSFTLSTSMLKMIRSPLQTPLLMACWRVFVLSSEHCPTASIPERCLLLAHIPCPPQHPRQSMNFSCLSFIQRIVDLLAEDSFSVLLMPFLRHASSDREAPNSLSHSVVQPALLLGAASLWSQIFFCSPLLFHLSSALEVPSLMHGF